jgi:archaemetzincin
MILTALLNTAVNDATVFYNCSTTVLPLQSLPVFTFYTSRQRYKADSVTKFQTRWRPPGCETAIGSTQKDISTSLPGKPGLGNFRMGYQPGNACVISVCRLESTRYKQYQEQFIKVLAHETGYNRGLPHCSYPEQCLVNDAGGSLPQLDKERKWLCGHCRKLLAA